MTALPAPLVCPSCGAQNEVGSSVCQNCTFVLVTLPQVHAGFLLASRYEITRALGAGGMGIVYEARDRLLNETVALKVLRPEVAATPDMAQRFISEIKIARTVSHRNVCRIHEYGEDRGLRYISMAFVGGVDLRRVLRERGPLATGLAFDVAIQATEGLEAVHEEGIVHRDLKPANITVDPRGVVRVMDFGLAKQSAGGDLSSGSSAEMVGTPEYMSPEQIRGVKLDPRSDIYSMGIVVYELFTGRTPFRAETPVLTILRHLNEPPPLDGVDTLPVAIVSVLKKALQKEPDMRYSSAEELGRAISAARSATAGAEDADFASLFGPRQAADPAQSAPPTWSGAQGLSQATWTTAVGRAAVEGVQAAPEEAPFVLDDVAAASVDPLEAPAEPLEAAEPVAVEPLGPSMDADDGPALAAVAPWGEGGAFDVSEPEEIGIEVQDPDADVSKPEVSRPEPAIASGPPPAARVPAAPSPAGRTPAQGTEAPDVATTPAARRRPDETSRLTPYPRNVRATPEPSRSGRFAPAPRTPLDQALAVVRTNPRYVLGAAAAAAVLLVALVILRLLAAPHVAGAEPARVPTGGTVVLTGTGFSAQADGNEVLFSGRPGRVNEASPTRLTAELPDLDFSWPEAERHVPVVVHVGWRSSAALDLTVYQVPRIQAISPDAGMPGDEVTITGSGWPLSATVRFGKLDAQVVTPGYKTITVRVPAARAGPGGSVPVVVVVAGQPASSPVQFRVGRPQP